MATPGYLQVEIRQDTQLFLSLLNSYSYHSKLWSFL